jgi:uncharacterized membrane protein YphA (DoxX/SURF4 family)
MPSPSIRLIPLILRVGLGFVWIYEGLVPKFLVSPGQEVEIVARSHLVPFDARAFVMGLGVVEVILGLALWMGLCVKWVAAVQLVLLIAFTLGLTVTSPELLVDPLGGVSKNVGLMAATLCLYLLS